MENQLNPIDQQPVTQEIINLAFFNYLIDKRLEITHQKPSIFHCYYQNYINLFNLLSINTLTLFRT